MPLIRQSLSKCLLQAVLLSYWEQGSKKNDSITSHLYELSPSLIHLLSDVLLKLSTKDVGIFFSTLRKATGLLAVFIIQYPTQSQLSSYCRDLEFAIQDACPHTVVCAFNSVETASLLVTVAQDATCSVCMREISESETEDEKPVVTKCGHVFHQDCLDTWVNKSCATASNTCPACRAEMCQARDREIIALNE